MRTIILYVAISFLFFYFSATHTLAQTKIIPKKQRTSKIEEAKKRNKKALHDLTRNMVSIKGGVFTMGCTPEQGKDCASDEKPAHKVTVGDFKISKYEVTLAQWKAVMGNNPGYFEDCLNCPVEGVNFREVTDFIHKLNKKTGKKYRLPSEAEWEYAARGGALSRGYKFSGSDSISEVAWYNGNSNGSTYPVGKKKPNELGLYDMSGNVWEWCYDRYDADYYNKSPDSNPLGPDDGPKRVCRGGSWGTYEKYCRVANRIAYSPDHCHYFFGFRLAKD